jgi:lipopolysaccharide export system permease protein
MTLLGRYIARQTLRPLIGILVAAMLALLAERTLQVVDVVIGWRGSLLVIFEMIGYLVPHYVGLALPAALFIAILVTMGRLSRDGELDAMLASGAGFFAVLRPIFILAGIVALINFAVQSHVQPYSRYAYRAAVFALSNVSFEALLKERQFVSIGDTTYLVNRLDEEEEAFEGLFLVNQQPDGALLTVTAERGRVIPATGTQPVTLELENGVQHYTPAPVEEGGAPATTLRFRTFLSDLTGAQPSALTPRGEHEREYTIPELWVSEGDPEQGIEPQEIAAELHVRLVRVVATLALPLVAAPLAIARRRARRSYGFIIGISLLLLLNQIVQLGKTLADNGDISVWTGMWLPLAVFVGIGLVLTWHKRFRVPTETGSGRFELALERLAARLGRLLPGAGRAG